MAQVYFDTPVFVQRMFGRSSEKAAVEHLVGRLSCTTSHYVREQYRATFVKAAILVHNLLRNHGNVGEVLRKLDSFPVTTGDGKKGRAALIRLMEITSDIDFMLMTLERWIEEEMLSCLEDGISVVDATSCARVAPRPTKNDVGIYSLAMSCTLESPRPCRIELFWRERWSSIEGQAGGDLRSLPKEAQTENVERAMTAASEVVDGRPPRGKRCFIHLSDSVIVEESTRTAVLVTTNVGDFVGVSRLMGRSQKVATVEKVEESKENPNDG